MCPYVLEKLSYGRLPLSKAGNDWSNYANLKAAFSKIFANAHKRWS